jgi:hypothetical protein
VAMKEEGDQLMELRAVQAAADVQLAGITGE